MTSADQSNPAARLYIALRAAKNISQHKSVKDVWKSVFEVDTDSIIILQKNLVLLSNLADEVEKEVQKLDVNPSVFLKHFPTIREILGVSNFSDLWQTTRAKLGEEVLYSLEFCSERLNAVRPEKILTEEDFKRISKEVNDLFALIAKAELPEELRSVLLDTVQTLQSALAQYRIRGVSGLRQELFVVIDRLQRNYSDLSNQKGNPAVQAVFKMLGFWDTLTSVALNTPQLLTVVFHTLT